jgi:hypothetical protein
MRTDEAMLTHKNFLHRSTYIQGTFVQTSRDGELNCLFISWDSSFLEATLHPKNRNVQYRRGSSGSMAPMIPFAGEGLGSR